jgi:hypothetical protein
MKPETNTTTTNRPNIWELPTAEEELTLCEIVRYIDLRAMHQSNGNSQALKDIMDGCFLDTLITGSTDENGEARTNDTATKYQLAEDARTKSAKARKRIADAKATLKRVRVTPEQIAEAEEVLNGNDDYIADNAMGEAHDIENSNKAQTFSLASDMLHHIWLELQAIKADPDRQTEKAFGELCKAGRQYIQDMTAVSTLDSVSTIARPLTTAQAVYYMTRYNADPGARPRNKWTQTAKGCTGYYTLEPMERKKDTDPAKVDPAIIASYARFNDMCVWYYEHVTLPSTASTYRTAYPALDAKAHAMNIWHRMTPAQKVTALGLDPADNPILYLVLHVPTIRTQYSTEDMSDKDPRTAEAVTESVLTAVEVVKLSERANLSERERQAIKALTSPEAVQTARTAYNEAMATGKQAVEKIQADRAKAGKKPYRPGKIRQLVKQYQTTANNAYTTALWAYALTKAGYKPSTHAKTRCVIRAKLTQAYNNAPDSMTPGMVDYNRMMKQTHRGHRTQTRQALQNPHQLLKATHTKTDSGKTITTWDTTSTADHTPVIDWTASGHAPQAINPGIDARAEEVLRRDSYRQTAPKATPPEKTHKERIEWDRLTSANEDTARRIAQFEAWEKAHAKA